MSPPLNPLSPTTTPLHRIQFCIVLLIHQTDMGRNIFRKVIQLTRSDDLHENRSRYSVEAAAHNANNSRLYNLPPELLATINDYLPLASGLTLRFTCSKFYQSSVFNHTQRCADQTDRFEALCHLEYDGVVKGYCCRGCLRRHLYYTAFSNEELAKKAHARYCLATMKCFRIGLFRELSFAELQKAYREQVKVRGRITEVHDCNDQGNLVAPEGCIYFYHRRRRIFTGFHIGSSSQLSSSSRCHFAEFCRSLNIPFCPHMTMGDDDVIDLFFRGDFCWHKCKRCKTKVCFNSRNPRAFLFVSRYFGKLSSPKDRKWLAHTFASKDSLLETHCEAVRDWQSKNPLNSRKPLQQLQLLQHENLRTPDFGNLFTSVTLPRSRWRQWFHGFIRGGGLGTRSTAIRSH
ncbi:hypothetical protein BDBG_03862 [Blastomyces gilchristii SLH14081]|uniref:F-box domain-containing protein n=1 Tax=Blastomyces gilchristii (strain SLH14081) TaxID=559298 RepID=A0A179UIK9_BLAGS|nr:uncharacterized protein BDBG_03862 [Blastomyces gilchristii SLH14081]OAT07834.1 hypothetical protein BDBG_03862 [Blastomyces gilchristii SLH14081]